MFAEGRALALVAFLFATAAGIIGTGRVLAQSSAGYSESLYTGMKWRLIGPFRGGRVDAVTGLPSNDLIYYMGTAGGGVWRTTDAGQVWTPIFEREGTGSIGAVAVASSDPNVIYVGTGEYLQRGDTTYGDGVYKSTDGGETWRHMGLTDTRHIARVLIDPEDPNRVFVAALGHEYGPNEDRGVFRSTDGGQTWEKVLYKNDTTGAVDLIFDPNNSQTLYAAMWTVQRKPWSLSSGGPADGLYKSTDGGSTWSLVGGRGWPRGMLGRIGVAMTRANPNRVYALMEAEGDERGLYRSDDGGKSWQQVNTHAYLLERPWYFTDVFADQQNADTVYVLDLGLWRSTDTGAHFTRIAEPHGDNHILWIDPKNSNRMILGNDGGATISNDFGRTWSSVYNQPTGQFYHVAADNQFDYRIYGAQQDNSSVSIASRTRHGGITVADFYPVGGGESGYDVPSPSNPDTVFSGNRGMENIARYDHRTEQAHDISEWPIPIFGWSAGQMRYRFNWTEPIAISPFNPHVIYHAAQLLFESVDDGASWKIISPDLTRNDKSKQEVSGGPLTQDNSAIEYYDVIFTVAESPLQKGLIWAGTDDGLVWLTRDGGAHWANVTPKDLPPWSKVSVIDPSPHVAGAAYVAVNRFKLDDLRPYIWKTTDYGKTWTSIASNIPAGAFVRAVREDPVRRGLLFAGTETGIYVSFNDGAQWQSLQLNLPAASVRDLIVHGDDLVIATHGRAFWSLDDIAPLRQINQAAADSSVYLYKPALAYRVRRGGRFGLGNGPLAENPPDGAVVDYYLVSAGQNAQLDILDSQGKAIRHFSLGNKTGMHRLVWDLRHSTPPDVVPDPGPWQGGPMRAPLALPGMYQVRLEVNGKTLTQPLEVKMDPEARVTQADLARQFDLMTRIVNRFEDLVSTVAQIHSARQRLAALRQRAGSDAPLLEEIDSVDRKASLVEDELYQHHLRQGAPEVDLGFPIRLRIRLIGLERSVDSADAAPTPQAYEVFQYLSQQLGLQTAKWKEIEGKDLPAVERMAAAAGLRVTPQRVAGRQ
ncbi:MAG TPA: hypothetical protein VGS20_04705 [Candidatus Acidoferrales bacterium]|nr:hypothetical protein [Candidatus Acidoferrales bacterium]